MNDYVLSIILGVIEGLTEFLPVSSTAHLRIAEALMHISLKDGYWKMFTIVIQLGAILCLPFYFRSRIAKFLSNFPRGERGDRNALTHPVGLTMIAFVFTAGPALLMTKIIGKHLESLFVMGMSLVVGGVVMWVVDNAYGALDNRGADFLAFNKPTSRVEDMTLPQAVWIGICQIFSAVFPGTSRSMSTIAAGQLTGMNRPAALEFSFFLSIPTMVAATLYDLYKSLRHGGANPLGSLGIDQHGWVLLGIGFVVSFVVAYGVVAWFMNWVRTRGFVPFAVYRLIVGAAVLVWALRG
ncbi:MAG: undecaprenyl-diphosphate phosphatase [Acidobacteriia bacterium]|nr:undecaprenyl-diphosphate phosphatase [Terriglobia bacterium]